MARGKGRVARGKGPRTRNTPGLTFETVARLARAFPGVQEGMSYRTPALRVRGKFLCRLREDGDTLAIKTSYEDRDFLLQVKPDTYYLTDHYRDYPVILVRLSRVGAKELQELLENSWRRAAPKRLVAAYDHESRSD